MYVDTATGKECTWPVAGPAPGSAAALLDARRTEAKHVFDNALADLTRFVEALKCGDSAAPRPAHLSEVDVAALRVNPSIFDGVAYGGTRDPGFVTADELRAIRRTRAQAVALGYLPPTNAPGLTEQFRGTTAVRDAMLANLEADAAAGLLAELGDRELLKRFELPVNMVFAAVPPPCIEEAPDATSEMFSRKRQNPDADEHRAVFC